MYNVKEWIVGDIVSGVSTGLVAVLQGKTVYNQTVLDIVFYNLLASIYYISSCITQNYNMGLKWLMECKEKFFKKIM